MKRINYIIITLCLFCLNTINAQKVLENLTEIKLNVSLHIIDNAVTEQEANKVIDSLNKGFQEAKISFTKVGSIKHYQQDKTKTLGQFVNSTKTQNTISIYFNKIFDVSFAPTPNYGELEFDGADEFMFLKADQYKSYNVAVHEMGHALGLYHTFENMFDIETYSSLLYGSGSSDTNFENIFNHWLDNGIGDKIADTNPDPYYREIDKTFYPYGRMFDNIQ